MSGNNALSPFEESSLKEIQELIGITQFMPDDTNYYHTIAGLLIQGGVTASIAGNTLSAAIPFNVGFPKKVFGVFLQPVDTVVAGAGARYSHAVSVPDLNNFQIANDSASAMSFYWWAIGL